MASLEARVRLVSGSTSLASSRSHAVTVDRPTDKGGSDLGFLGGELFLAGQGGCFLSNLVAAARARGIELRSAEVRVTGVQGDNPPHFAELRVAVMIDADTDEESIDRLISVAERSCIVTNTVRQATPLTFTRLEPSTEA
jgi:putative redox protein